MKDIVDDNPHMAVSDLSDGMQFLLERDLLALTAEVDETQLYSVTADGMRAIYMLGLVLASGVTADELDGVGQPPEARQVSQCASALVKALDEIGMAASVS